MCMVGVILTLRFWSRFFMYNLYSIDSYLYVSCSGTITSVGEERANLSAIVYL